jgi:hypothetical protein
LAPSFNAAFAISVTPMFRTSCISCARFQRQKHVERVAPPRLAGILSRRPFDRTCCSRGDGACPGIVDMECRCAREACGRVSGARRTVLAAVVVAPHGARTRQRVPTIQRSYCPVFRFAARRIFALPHALLRIHLPGGPTGVAHHRGQHDICSEDVRSSVRSWPKPRAAPRCSLSGCANVGDASLNHRGATFCFAYCH